MGQYFRSVTKQDGIITVYNGDVNNRYTMAKLMEHSWWENDLLKAIGNKFYKKKGQLMWVGDYTDDGELEKLTKNEVTNDYVWGDNKGVGIKKSGFAFDNKYLCNHTKKLYVNLKTYYDRSLNDDGWCINPLSLLTAVGNGRGGGDYWGINQRFVGKWAWDVISIEDTIPEKYKEFPIWFAEK